MSNKMTFKHHSIRIFDIGIDPSPSFKAILVSDLHIGFRSKKSQNRRAIVEKLRALVQLEHATVVFILGDIVSYKVWNIPKDWTKTFRAFESIGVPVHILPGNHDRYEEWMFGDYRGTNVHYYKTELIRLIPSNSTRMVCLGHDFKNDKKIHDVNGVRSWFNTIREVFHEHISDDSLLVTGHVHEHIHSLDNLSHCILPYSIDHSCFQYGILTFNQDNIFEVTFHHQNR